VIAGGFSFYILRIKRKLARSVDTGKHVVLQEHSRNDVLEQLANGAPLENILRVITSGVEQSNPACAAALHCWTEAAIIC